MDVDAVAEIINALENVKGKIYVIGNGGSAATASHMVNDLGAGLRRRKIRSFDVESLSDNTPVCTALANDIGYKNVFYMQLKDRITPDDILIAISCSGNSKNITKAVKYSKKNRRENHRSYGLRRREVEGKIRHKLSRSKQKRRLWFG